MEIEKAINIICEILELCSQLEEDTLSEACSGIYNDICSAKEIEHVMNSASELMVFINEAPWEDMEYLKEEIDTIYNKLLEEYEDF